MYESPAVGMSSQYLASPGYRILRELRARRVWALANEPAGSGFEPAIPEVFQQDLVEAEPRRTCAPCKSLDARTTGNGLAQAEVRPGGSPVGAEAAAPVTVRPAYGPEHEEAGERQKQLTEADSAKRESERQHLEGLFSDHFNTAIGKASTPSGKKAVIGDRPPRSFTNILASIIPQVYHEVAAARGIQTPYNTRQAHRHMMAIGAEMMNPRRKSFGLQHYDPHTPGPHQGKTYGAYFGMVARKIAQEHFNNLLARQGSGQAELA